MSIRLEDALTAYGRFFSSTPTIAARAPGRVNIIGEHTDYNDGFVLPMAIEHDTLVLGVPREDGKLFLRAETLGRSAEAHIDKTVRSQEEPWTDYILGVADELKKLGQPLCGADLLILGDVPVGCGLSSSAALEMATLAFFEKAGAFQLEGSEAARLGQRVENDFLGLSTGIMDQFISRCGRAGHALFLDCRSYEFELVPVAFEHALFVIANTACPRGLTASKYNERVAECTGAVDSLRAAGGAGHKLRDYTLDDLMKIQGSLDEVNFRRARHVITENERTVQAKEAMESGALERLGELMNASDRSLQEDYEVTSPELDVLTALARDLPGCHGARMTGAGFGGCTINLVARNQVDVFCEALLAAYKKETGRQGEVYVSAPAEGAGASFLS
ncbi:MAG: galactokinase [Candidatus Hydrogenedens sp.]|jgi:galactokinase|nr:galactokinase [Candidatus Hydrogenedens sp.]